MGVEDAVKQAWEKTGGSYLSIDDEYADFSLYMDGTKVAMGIYSIDDRLWPEYRVIELWRLCDYDAKIIPLLVTRIPCGDKWVNLNFCDISRIFIENGNVNIDAVAMKFLADLNGELR